MKKNKLFRSAKLSNLEDEDLDILEKNKIFKIIDLRDPVEIEKAPDNLSSNLLKKYLFKKLFSSYVCDKHCKVEFIKQVLPKLHKPVNPLLS